MEGAVHKHSPLEESKRKNFNFPQEAEAKMKELIELNVNSHNMRKHLIEKGIFTEETAPSDTVFYSKTNHLRKKMNLNRKNIGVRELEDLIESCSIEPEDPTDPYVIKHVVEEDETGKLRYSVMFSSKKLMNTYMRPGKNWVLSVDAMYQTNTEDCPLIFFGSSRKDENFNRISAILSNREDKAASDLLFEFVKNVSDPVPTLSWPMLTRLSPAQ
jgi:hypothetical protein